MTILHHIAGPDSSTEKSTVCSVCSHKHLNACLLCLLSLNRPQYWCERYMSRLMTKPTKWYVRPAKTQISLGIRPVKCESSLSAWRKLGSLATHWAHSEDSEQTDAQADLSLRWAHSHFVCFVMRRLNYVFIGICYLTSLCLTFLIGLP